MAYIAQKPCTFAGISFKIGDTVPEELIVPGAISGLIKMNIITAHEQNTAAGSENAAANKAIADMVTIVVRADEGNMPLEITAEGLQAIFDVLNSSVSEAEPIIAEMTDGDALILLHISDSRKSIKEAAEARAKAINKAEDEENGGEA